MLNRYARHSREVLKGLFKNNGIHESKDALPAHIHKAGYRTKNEG